MGLLDFWEKRQPAHEMGYYEQIFDEVWLPEVLPSDYQLDGIADVLSAIFEQYRSLFNNREPLEAQCSFNYSDEWTSNVDILRGGLVSFYQKICKKKGIEAFDFGDIMSYKNVPFIQQEELVHTSKIAAVCYLHLRDMKIEPFASLPVYPSDDDLEDAINRTKESEDDIITFLMSVMAISIEVEDTLRTYSILYCAYDKYVLGFLGLAVNPEKEKKTIERAFKESITTFEQELKPYNDQLKAIGAIPEDWEYSYLDMPLSSKPYYEKFGTDLYLKINRQWKAPQIRKDVSTMVKIGEAMMSGSPDSSVDVLDLMLDLYK